MPLEPVNESYSIKMVHSLESEFGLLKTEPIKILLVEDNPGDARLVLEMLRETNAFQFQLIHVALLAEALVYLAKEQIAVLLLDLSLPDAQGLETVTHVREAAPDIPIVIMSGLDNDGIPLKALQQGAQDYLVKGHIDSYSLVRSLHYAIERQRMQTELKQAQQELQKQVELARLLGTIASRIRQSLNLNATLNTTVAEVRQFLRADRVVVYRFAANGAGTVVAESVTGDWSSVLGQVFADPWLSEGTPHKYLKGQVQAVSNLVQSHLPTAKAELLTYLQIQAFLSIPILQDGQVWGLLSAHQCSGCRHWQTFEIDLVEQLAIQVAIAIQQAQLYQQVQTLNADLEHQVEERTQQLKQEKVLLEAVVNAIPDQMFRYNKAGVCLDFLPALDFERPKPALGQAGLDRLPPEMAQQRLYHIQQALQTSEIQFCEYQLLDPDGTPHDYEVRIVASGSDEALAIMRDISDRKLAEQALRQSQANLFALIENTQDHIWSIDTACQLITLNSAFRQCFREVHGVELQPGMQILEFVTIPQIRTLWQGLYDRALAGEHFVTEIAYDYLPKPRYVECSLNPIIGEQGEVTGISIFSRDITDRKRAEAALQESEARFRLMFQAAAVGVVLSDLEGRLLDLNPAYEQMLGYSKAELYRAPFTGYTHPDDIEPDLSLFHQLVAGDLDYYEIEKRFLCKDGQLLWARLRVSLIRDIAGRPRFEMALVENINERKQAESLMLRQRQVLEMIATGAALPDVLDVLCRIVEAQFSQLSCAILLVDEGGEQLRLGAAPSLVPDLQGACHQIPIGPNHGSCGTAAFLKQRVIAPDISSDPVWTDSAELLLKYGLQGSCSVPIFSENGQLLGTLCLYYHETHHPSERELQLAEIVSHLAGIAIEREQIEEALRLTQFCVDHTADAVFWVGPDARFSYVNEAACRALGYSRAELLTMNVYDISPNWSANEWSEKWAEVKQRGSFIFESHHRAKNGSIFPAEVTVNYLEFNGKEYICSFARDITERKRVELELKQNEARFRSLVRNAMDGITLLTADGTVLYESPSIERRLGYRPEELIGTNTFDLIHADDYDRVMSVFQEGLGKPGVTLSVQYRCRHKDGSWRYIEAVGCNLLHEPSVASIVVNNRDVTEQNRYEAELHRARDAAEAGSRAKSEFLAVMSHELRTPLNAVLGLSELLRQEIFGSLNPKQREYIACIHSSGEHLLSLINDILDLSKIEAGKEDLMFTPVVIADLCHYCLSVVRERAIEHGLKLMSQIDVLAQSCIADERRLRQMLLNLLSNAIKFTPSGEIHLTVQKQPQGIAFTVSDTGIGIAPENLSSIFEPFHQVDSRLNRRFEGTGLGLALTRRLARLHGGEVTVESAPEQGSHFTLYLPDAPLQSSSAIAAEPRAGKPQTLLNWLNSNPVSLQKDSLASSAQASQPTQGKVLVVEDDLQSAMLLRDYLQSLNYEVTHLSDGTHFLEQVRSIKPDLVLLDVQLTNSLNGLELLVLLRKQPDLQTLPVVMITAMAMTGDRERAVAAGANEYLSKPITLAQLDTVLGSIRSS